MSGRRGQQRPQDRQEPEPLHVRGLLALARYKKSGLEAAGDTLLAGYAIRLARTATTATEGKSP